MRLKKSVNRRGFTLTELLVVVGVIGVILAIAFPVYTSVKKSTLEKQYSNLKMEIETKAEVFARETSIVTVSVETLIKEGYLPADSDEGLILNPVNNESLNCRIVEITYENGEYTAELTEKGSIEEDGTCAVYDVKVASLINAECYSADNNEAEIASCEKAYENSNGWYRGSVRLSANPVEGKTIETYRWSSLTGTSSEEDHLIVGTDSTLYTTYTLTVTFDDETSTTSNLILQIDNEAPTILSVNQQGSWSSGAKEIEVDATDGSFSGLDSYYIGTSATCDGEFTKDNTASLGEGTYYACAQDKAGNISAPTEFVIENIDDQKPLLSDGVSGFTTVRSTMGITYYSEMVRQISFTDVDSGVAEVKYCFTSDTECTPTTNATIAPRNTVTTEFVYPSAKAAQRVCVKAIDDVGNESDVICDTTFKVDATAPTTVTATPSTTKAHEVTVRGTDNESGINRYVCNYGTTSNNLDKTVTVNSASSSAVCDLGILESGKTYYIQVSAYNEANLVSESEVESFKANVTIDSAYEVRCGTATYCNEPLYVNYNNKIFIVYKNSGGYKAILSGIDKEYYFLQTGCCNNGNCTYSGSHYPNSMLASYLNNEFLNNLTYYSSKLLRATWYTGLYNNVRSRTTSAYVGLMDYEEYTATKSFTYLYTPVNNNWWWLMNPVAIRSGGYYNYQSQMIVRYSNGTFFEDDIIVNTKSGVRPVIVLKPGIVFTSGDGSINNPYKVL